MGIELRRPVYEDNWFDCFLNLHQPPAFKPLVETPTDHLFLLQEGRHEGHDILRVQAPQERHDQAHPAEAEGLLLHHAGRQPHAAPDRQRDHAHSLGTEVGPDNVQEGQGLPCK